MRVWCPSGVLQEAGPSRGGSVETFRAGGEQLGTLVVEVLTAPVAGAAGAVFLCHEWRSSALVAEAAAGHVGVLAYALSWAWWVPMAVHGDVSRAGQGWPTHLIGLAGPAIAAVITAGSCGGWRDAATLLRRCLVWRVPMIAGVAVAAAVLLALLAMLVAGDPSDSLSYSGAPELGVLTVLFVLLLNGFGEELGWRGFMVTRLRTERSLRDTSVIVWLVWGCWHLPLFWIVANFRDFGVAGTVGWAVGLFFGSVFLAWLVGAARGSVLVVALWHPAYNFATATEAAAGAVPAAATMVVVLATVWIMRNDVAVPESTASRE